MIREKTQFPGVYRRKTKKNDIAYDIAYRSEGKKIWEKVGLASEGYSEKLASIVRGERIRSLRHGDELPNQKAKAPLMKDVWTRYEKWIDQNRAGRGFEDKCRYKKHLKTRFENKRMNEIAPFDIEGLKIDLKKKNMAPATINHILKLLNQIFNKAIEWNLFRGINPVKKIKLLTKDNQRIRFLSHEEAALLLDELKKASMAVHDIALISLHTGMRCGEVFNLRGHDIDLTNNLIMVRDPKNKKNRHCFITNSIREVLERRNPERPGDLVFPDRYGQKRKGIPVGFRKTIKKLGFNNGVEDRRYKVCFHSLRHTFASWLALQGESLLTIKELLGHKSIQMTERYSHLSTDHKRSATSRLAEFFNAIEKDPKRAKETP